MPTDRFTRGYLAACQNLVVAHGLDGTAEDLLRESGMERRELLRAQRESGYGSRRMCPIIRSATPDDTGSEP